MSEMTVGDLVKAHAKVADFYRTEIRAAVQRGTVERDAADKLLSRWTLACDKARVQLELACVDGGNVDNWWHDETHVTYVFDSRTSLDSVYVQYDECHCKAWDNGNPCWHRAAARMIQHWQQAVAEQREQEQRISQRTVSDHHYSQLTAEQRRQQLARTQELADQLFS